MHGRDWAAVAVAGGLVGIGLLAASKTTMVQLLKLEPGTRAKAQQLIERLGLRGIKLKVTSTTRTEEEQQEALAKGASATSVSWHFSGRAFDVLVWDDRANGGKGAWDEAGKRQDLYRIVHQEWSKLGGQGLAYAPYPDGPVRYLKTAKGQIWDGGHLEFHGPYLTASAAWLAIKGKAPVA